MFKQKHLLCCVLAWLVFMAVYHAFTMRALYADGASYLVHMLESLSFNDWDGGRRHAQVLMQIPLVSALQLDVTDINILTVLHGAGIFLPPTVFWVLALIFLRDEEHCGPMLMLFSLAYMNLSFMAIGEFEDSYALAGLSFAILISGKPVTLLRRIMLLLAALILLRTYESLVFLGPLLALAALLRLVFTGASSRTECALVIICLVLYITAAVLAAIWVIMPNSPQNRGHAISGIVHVAKNPQLLLTIIACAAYFPAVYIRTFKPIRAALYGLAAILCLLLFYPGNWAHPSEHYSARLSAGLCMFFLLLFMLIMRYVQRRHVIDTSSLFIPVLLLAALSVPDIYKTREHAAHLETFRSFVNANTGFHSVDDTAFAESEYLWPWNQPTMSLVLRTRADKAIVLNSRSYKGWVPFDPKTELPDLSRYYEQDPGD